MKITDKYTFFYKDKIAQWNMTKFMEDEITFNCAEQYMMYHKALLMNDIEISKQILNSTNPSDIQKLGRKIKNFDQTIWDNNKSKIVYQANFLKFSQNTDLRNILLSTNNTILVEVSPYDKIWGIGLDINHPDIYNSEKWNGLNLLGFILTEVRNKLIKQPYS